MRCAGIKIRTLVTILIYDVALINHDVPVTFRILSGEWAELQEDTSL